MPPLLDDPLPPWRLSGTVVGALLNDAATLVEAGRRSARDGDALTFEWKQEDGVRVSIVMPWALSLAATSGTTRTSRRSTSATRTPA